jgi:hypothetical protein
VNVQDGATDWLFDNIHFYWTSTGTGVELATSLGGTIARIAFTNFTTERSGSNPDCDWAFHAGAAASLTHITFANGRVNTCVGTGGEQTIRLNSATLTGIVFIDMLFNDSMISQYPFRIGMADGVFMKNVVLVGGAEGGIMCNFNNGTSITECAPGDGIVMDNVSSYHPDGNTFILVVGSTNGSIGSSDHYTGNATPTFNLNGFSDGGGNAAHSWDGSTIDYSEMTGHTTGASSYGADH